MLTIQNTLDKSNSLETIEITIKLLKLFYCAFVQEGISTLIDSKLY